MAPSRAPYLDRRTQLPESQVRGRKRKGGSFSVAAYPGAGEATIAYVPECSAVEKPDRRRRRWPEAAADPEDNERRAESRARTEVRRTVVTHRMTRLITLTYAVECWDREQAYRDLQAMWDQMHPKRDGWAALVVVEVHPGGHGLHLHMLMSDPWPVTCAKAVEMGWVCGSRRRIVRVDERWCGKCLLCLWGQGGVNGRKIRTGQGGRNDARRAASYVAPYLGKEFGATAVEGVPASALREPGQKRYWRTQGCRVEVRRMRCERLEEAYWAACDLTYGGLEPDEGWVSEQCEDWRGPPVWVLRWVNVDTSELCLAG